MPSRGYYSWEWRLENWRYDMIQSPSCCCLCLRDYRDGLGLYRVENGRGRRWIHEVRGHKRSEEQKRVVEEDLLNHIPMKVVVDPDHLQQGWYVLDLERNREKRKQKLVVRG